MSIKYNVFFILNVVFFAKLCSEKLNTEHSERWTRRWLSGGLYAPVAFCIKITNEIVFNLMITTKSITYFTMTIKKVTENPTKNH